MSSMGVGAALAVLLLFITIVEAGKGGVTFWRKDFIMTCPESGNWFYKDQNLSNNNFSHTHTVAYENGKKGPYYCEYGDPKTKYYFYVHGKVCDNCFELDAILFGLVIVVDVAGTALMMMIIYRYTKKKSSAGHAHASKAPARSGGRAPPVPSPDYEQLNVHTRSQDTYSIMNKTG